MQFLKFIECRIGEPITALDVHKNMVLLGSISGYYAIYDMDADITLFSEKCEKHTIRDCCLHVGAKRKFKNQSPELNQSRAFSRNDKDNSMSQQEDSVFGSDSNFGKSSMVFKEASQMVFDFEQRDVDLAYLAVGDSGVLRVDIKRFFRERLIKKDSEGKVLESL